MISLAKAYNPLNGNFLWQHANDLLSSGKSDVLYHKLVINVFHQQLGSYWILVMCHVNK